MSMYVRRKHRKTLLTRRLITLVIFAFVLILGYSWLTPSHTSEQQIVYQPIVVESGDTLWSLAEKSGVTGDTRSVIHDMMHYNGLIDSTIQPGQIIYVPVAMSSIASR